MPVYKQRRIELTPKEEATGTWRCAYRVIEFRPTSWGYCEGHSDSLFASREAAAAAALEQAKRIVDSLEFRPHNPGSKRSTVLGMCEKSIRRLFAFSQ